MDDAERLAHLQLWLTEGVGPERRSKLLEVYGTASGVFAAGHAAVNSLKIIPSNVAERLFDPTLPDRAENECRRMRELGVQWFSVGDEDYPKILREIPKPPQVLTVLGELQCSSPAVAIVGSRKCSSYGRQMAAKISAELARNGVVVVSGLARGIDAVAHEAALEVNGQTVAVLASGLANIYPPEHENLAARIAQSGALVSEATLDGPPVGGLFPLRNRIISGLSLGVVIVEAAERSGAISTAYHALDQNREVFAVPGRLDDPGSAGALELLRKGATLIRHAGDVLEQLGPMLDKSLQAPEKAAKARAISRARTPANPSPSSVTETSSIMPEGLADDEAKIWLALGVDGLDAETLMERTGLAASGLSAKLLMLEMRRIVARRPGNRFIRT